MPAVRFVAGATRTAAKAEAFACWKLRTALVEIGQDRPYRHVEHRGVLLLSLISIRSSHAPTLPTRGDRRTLEARASLIGLSADEPGGGLALATGDVVGVDAVRIDGADIVEHPATRRVTPSKKLTTCPRRPRDRLMRVRTSCSMVWTPLTMSRQPCALSCILPTCCALQNSLVRSALRWDLAFCFFPPPPPPGLRRQPRAEDADQAPGGHLPGEPLVRRLLRDLSESAQPARPAGFSRAAGHALGQRPQSAR